MACSQGRAGVSGPSAWGFLTGVLVPVLLPVFACFVIVPLLCLLLSLYLWVLLSLSGLLV